MHKKAFSIDKIGELLQSTKGFQYEDQRREFLSLNRESKKNEAKRENHQYIRELVAKDRCKYDDLVAIMEVLEIHGV